MTAIPKASKLTVEEYLAIEEKAESRSEFYDGQMFLMAGASREHNTIFSNLFLNLAIPLKGARCRIFGTDQRVRIERTGLYTYPDLLIVCGTPEYAPENRNTLINPRVVIEILSDSTEHYDRTTKFRHYKKLPSVMEYVLVAQNEPVIERYIRLPDGQWAQTDFVGLEATLALATVPASVPLAEVYLDVEFRNPQEAIGPVSDANNPE